jgi:hypothetical protein
MEVLRTRWWVLVRVSVGRCLFVWLVQQFGLKWTELGMFSMTVP